jgi:hypothetical protein
MIHPREGDRANTTRIPRLAVISDPAADFGLVKTHPHNSTREWADPERPIMPLRRGMNKRVIVV